MRKRVRFVSTHGEEIDALADAITAVTKTDGGMHVYFMGSYFEVDEGEYRNVRDALRTRRRTYARRPQHARG